MIKSQDVCRCSEPRTQPVELSVLQVGSTLFTSELLELARSSLGRIPMWIRLSFLIIL